MRPNPYNTDLDRNPANHQPLTPLTFLERAASIFPGHTAIVHGAIRRSYGEFYERSRRLASALAGSGVERGDTVSALLPNVPAMLESHYGVPMSGAVLHSINTRLDAAIIAFQLDHAGTKVVIVDTEFLPKLRQALALASVTPLVVTSADTEFAGPPVPPGDLDYETFLAAAIPTSPGSCPRMNGTRSRSTTPRGRRAIQRGSSRIIAEPICWRRATC